MPSALTLKEGSDFGERALALSREMGWRADESFALWQLAFTTAPQGQAGKGLAYAREALAIATEISKGVTWGQDAWHKVRVERKAGDGTIKVYYDDLSKPIMVGEDKTFGSGYIGFGSFDDKGKVDNIKIYTPSVESKPTVFFQAK